MKRKKPSQAKKTKEDFKSEVSKLAAVMNLLPEIIKRTKNNEK